MGLNRSALRQRGKVHPQPLVALTTSTVSIITSSGVSMTASRRSNLYHQPLQLIYHVTTIHCSAILVVTLEPISQPTMDFSNAALPAHYGLDFTKTFHSKVPANIDPSSVTLPKPLVVVVTGAGKGLGYHISLAFARAGCSGIAISSRTSADLDALESEIIKIAETKVREIEVIKVVCDVQSNDDVQRLQQEVRNKWNRIDVVIANAGVISSYIAPSDSSKSNLPQGLVQDNDWARVMDINLNGVWRVSRAFLPLLSETKDGPQTLVSSCSMAAHSAVSELTPVAYNMSKMGVMRLMECIANDHGKEGVQA